MGTLSVVALLTGIPKRDLRRGLIGTIAENLAPEFCEVEFSDDEGRAYATAALPS